MSSDGSYPIYPLTPRGSSLDPEGSRDENPEGRDENPGGAERRPRFVGGQLVEWGLTRAARIQIACT